MVRDRQRSYAFGPFVLDTARHLLLREGEPVSLTPKSYDTLLVLVESGGSMMSKDELMSALWPDHSVEEANLTQQISTTRKALGDGTYIVTVPGRGYRFAVPVQVLEDASETPARKPGSGLCSRSFSQRLRTRNCTGPRCTQSCRRACLLWCG